MSESANLMIRVMGDADQAVGALESVGGKLQSVGARALGLGASMTAISGPLALVGGVALNTAMDYESAMYMMEATSGATADQMAAVGSAAIALGSDMTLPGTSAADAAEAMTELSRAGLSVEDSMAAALGTLRLAAAAEVSNAEAATIAGNALNMFGLAGSEATRVADLLAAGANASSADIRQMAMALQMSGSVAAAAGMPIEDLTTAIGLMANAGIQGSDAGTSLKTMLMRLMNPTAEAAGLMEALGISVYDSQGEMRPMSSLIGQFTGALSGLTQEQRNAALATIFGTDAVRAANVVLMGGTEAWEAMSGAVNRSGAAGDLAGARMSGLRGALEGLKSTAETLLLEAALPFLGALEGIVRGGAALIARVGELNPALLNAGIAFGAVLAVAGPLLLGFGALTLALSAFATPVGLVIVALGAVAALFAGLGPTITAHADAIEGALGPTWRRARAVVAQAADAIRGIVQGALEVVQRFVQQHGAEIRAWFSGAWNQVITIVTQAMQVVAGVVLPVLRGVGQFISAHADEIVGVMAVGWRAISGTISTVLSGVSGVLRAALAALRGDWSGAWTALRETALGVWQALLGAAEAIFPGLGTRITGVVDTMQARLSAAWTTIQQGWAMLVAFFQPTIERVGEAFRTLGVLMDAQVRPALQGLGAALAPLGAALAGLLPVIASIAGAIGGILVGAVNLLMEVFAAIVPHVAGVVAGIVTAVTGLIEFVTGVVNTIVAILHGDWAAAWAGAQQIVQGVVDLIGGLLTALASTVVGIVQGLVEGVIAFFQNLYYTLVGGSVVPDLVTGIIGWFTTLWTTLSTIAESIRSFLVTSWTAIQATATTIWSGIRSFLSTTWTAIQTTVTTILTAIQSFLSTMWSAIQATVTTIWSAIQSFLSTTWTAIQTTVTTILTEIQAFLSTTWTAIQTTATTIWSAIQAFLSTTWTAIQTTVTTILTEIQAFLSTTWTAIQTTVTTILTEIQSFLSTTWTAIKTTATELWDAIRLAIREKVLEIQGMVEYRMNLIRDFVRNAWNQVKEVSARLWGEIKGAILGVLDGLVGDVFGRGAALVQRFADGIIGALHTALDAARRLAQELRDLLPGSDARTGPLNDLGASGRAFGERFAWGVARGGPEVLGAAEGLMGGLSDTISAGGGALAAAMQSALGPLGTAVDLYQMGVDLGMQLVTGMRDAIMKGLQDVFGALPMLTQAATITPGLAGWRGRPAVQDDRPQTTTITLNGPFYLREERDVETLARQISAILAGDAATIDRMAVQWVSV
jgi:TP901 family phage tail tape measure protein